MLYPRTIALAAFALFFLYAGTLCSQESPTQTVIAPSPRDTSPVYTPAELALLVEGNNAFALELFGQLRQQSQGNLFFSPYSISQALGMTWAGARDETERQMAEVLHFSLGQVGTHRTFNGLDLTLAARADVRHSWESGDRFRLNVANSIWTQEGYDLLPDFVANLGVNYGIESTQLDFRNAPEPARQTINTWVADRTEGRIQNLIPENGVNELTRLVLTNAIYFNASWEHQFSEFATRDDTFHLLDGREVTVPMMNQVERFSYGTGDGYEMVRLPYLGQELSMVVLLPDAGRYADIEAALTVESLTSMVASAVGRDIDLHLPRFRMESEFSLAETLKDMGMPIAFDPGGANFTGIVAREAQEANLFISAVIHKAFVSVEETGTEAAAATAVIVDDGTGLPDEPSPPPVPFRADRPFIVVIRDDPTDAILFVGRVLNPVE